MPQTFTAHFFYNQIIFIIKPRQYCLISILRCLQTEKITQSQRDGTK